jgi:hypothetical protein
MSFLAEYLDLAITVRAEDSAEIINAAEVERLQHLVAVLQAAAAHPRRLGGDAMPEELAQDKKRAKRLAHAAAQALKGWGGETASWEDASKVAATINFEEWWGEHERRIRSRQRYIATWCHRYGNNNGDARWCNSAIVRLENELKWFKHALR